MTVDAETTPTRKSMAFRSERTEPDIQVPRYVFDLWLPLLGVDVIGVYSTYCRLEDSGTIHGMTMEHIAHQLRIGAQRLREINKTLEECGFILVCKPIGAERLVHLCTTIVVQDAPREISAELLAKYKSDIWGYQPLLPDNIEEVEVEQPQPKRTIDSAYGAAYFVDKLDKCETVAPELPNGRSRYPTDTQSISHTEEVINTLPIREIESNIVLESERPNRRRVAAKRDNSAVAFSTPGAAYMVELYVKEGAALHRSPPGKFPSITAKERFEAAEAKLGLEAFKKALVGCFTSRGYPSIAQVIGYVEKVETNGNGNGQNNAPAKSTLPPLLFQKVAEAIRYNPEAVEHIPRISRLTETCQQRGYTEEQVRKAGKLWWETWPGNTSKGPSDAEFLQKIEIVKKERL